MHITSMAGTWLAIVQGFGGMRIVDGKVRFNPIIPSKWNFNSFNIRFKGNLLNVKVYRNYVEIRNKSNRDIPIILFEKQYILEGGRDLVAERNN